MTYNNKIIREANNSNISLLEKDRIMKENLIIHRCEVHDLTDGQKTANMNVTKKTLRLKSLLTEIDSELDELCGQGGQSKQVKCLLEYQMSVNKKANVVFSQIYYHFAEYSPIVVKPMLKNQIKFKPELEYYSFTRQYTNRYCANKAHSKANFLFFFETFGFSSFLTKIKKKNLDDAADSFMQIFGYLSQVQNRKPARTHTSQSRQIRNLRILP
jgi:hypothetical protein